MAETTYTAEDYDRLFEPDPKARENPSAADAPQGPTVTLDQNAQDAGVTKSPEFSSSDYDKAFADADQEDEVFKDTRAKFLEWYNANLEEDPETAAEVGRLSYITGIPPNAVASDLPKARQLARTKGVDWNRITRDHPVLADWLANPIRHALVADDVASLEGIAWWIGSWEYDDRLGSWDWHPGAIQRRFQRGMAQREEAQVGAAAAAEGQKLDDLPRVRELAKDLVPWDYGEDARSLRVLGRSAGALAELLPNMVGGTLRGLKYGGAAAAAVAGAEAAAAVPTGGLSLLGIPISAATAFQTGYITGLALDTYQIENGAAYLEMLKEQKRRGGGEDPKTAAVASNVVGLINAGLEMMPGLAWLKLYVPYFRKLGKETLRTPAKEALKKYGLGLGREALEGAKSLAWETGTEAAQQLVTSTGRELSIWKGGGETQWSKLPSEAWGEFTGALEGMWLLSVLGMGQNVLGNYRNVQRARRNVLAMNQLAEVMKESKSVVRSPDAVEEVASELAKKSGAPPTLFAKLESWNRHFQEQNVDPREAAREVLGDTEAYDEATRLGAELAIPIEKWTAKIAPTEAHAALVQDVATEPGGPTLRESMDPFEAIGNETQAAVEEARKSSPADLTGPSLAVFEDWRSRAMVTGDPVEAEHSAMVMQAIMTRLADRMTRNGVPMTAIDIYNRYKVSVGAVDSSGLSKASGISETQMDLFRQGWDAATGTPPAPGLAPQELRDTGVDPVPSDALKPGMPVPYEAGAALTEDQRAGILGRAVDALEVAGQERKVVGYHPVTGQEVHDFVDSPDLYQKSDISGNPSRYYVQLPDGRKASPSELWPEITEDQVARAVRTRQSSYDGTEDFLRWDRVAPVGPGSVAAAAEAFRIERGSDKLAQAYRAQDRHGRTVYVDALDPGDVEYWELMGFRKVLKGASEVQAENRDAGERLRDEGLPGTDDGTLPGGPATGEGLSQTRDWQAWVEKLKANPEVRKRFSESDLESFIRGMEMTAMIFGDFQGVPLEGPGSPLRENLDPLFNLTFDITTACPRQDQYVATIIELERRLSRVFKTEERHLIGRMMKELGVAPACWYCYGQSARDAFDDAVTRNAAIVSEIQALQKKGQATEENLRRVMGYTPRKAGVGDPWIRPSGVGSRFMSWDGSLGSFVRANAKKLPKMDPVRLLGLIKGVVEPKSDLEAELADKIRGSAQVASMATTIKGWATYTNQVLRLSDDLFRRATEAAGFRLNSQTDYRPWHVMEVAEFLVHLSRGGGGAPTSTPSSRRWSTSLGRPGSSSTYRSRTRTTRTASSYESATASRSSTRSRACPRRTSSASGRSTRRTSARWSSR